MPITPTKEREFRLDALERMNNWFNMLEERIYALLATNDPDSMQPAEREQAANRHLMFMLRLLQLRQQYAQAIARDEDLAIHEEHMQEMARIGEMAHPGERTRFL